jgi:hypothetical protein
MPSNASALANILLIFFDPESYLPIPLVLIEIEFDKSILKLAA